MGLALGTSERAVQDHCSNRCERVGTVLGTSYSHALIKMLKFLLKSEEKKTFKVEENLLVYHIDI